MTYLVPSPERVTRTVKLRVQSPSLWERARVFPLPVVETEYDGVVQGP